jgi:hypothetical protein
MRESRPEILTNSKGEICALILQASYCAEQECGIAPLLEVIGANHGNLTEPQSNKPRLPEDYQGPWGLRRWEISTAFEGFALGTSKETKAKLACAALAVSNNSEALKELVENPPEGTKLRYYRGVPLENSKTKRDEHSQDATAQWADDGFHVCAVGPAAQFIEDFAAALKAGKNAVIWLGGAGNNPFARSGLCLGLLDRIDPENIEQSEQGEKENHDTLWAGWKTGIYDLIPSTSYFTLRAGKALKSRRRDGGTEEISSAFPVMFWLNPSDQKRNNFGWFTVEELTAWAKNQDNPISKKSN